MMTDTTAFNLDTQALFGHGKVYGQKMIVTGDLELQGNVLAHNLPMSNWSVVEYVVRIIRDTELQDATRLKIALGAVTAPLDAQALTKSLNEKLDTECFPFRGVIEGFTHKTVQDGDEVWVSETIAYVSLRHVGIEDLMDATTGS